MNDTQRRLIRSIGPARTQLAVDVGLGLAAVGLIIAQATLLASLIAGVFLDGRSLDEMSGELIALAAVAAARGLVGAGFEAAGRIGALRVMAELRRRLVAKLLYERPTALRGEQRGELAAAAVQGVDAIEAYFARYLPQLVIAALAPLAILAWCLPRDPAATLILAVTFPLIPVFMILVGKAAEHRSRQRWRTLARLSGHFLDVVSGLKTLRANARAEAQVEVIAAAGERYRSETMRTLRVGFLSALILELLAMLGTALVAATIGVQLAGGNLGLEEGLTVLILAPELYLPLRRLGAQFHASTDGMAAAERIFEVLDMPSSISVPDRPRPCPDPAHAGIALREVSFTYPGRPEPALRSVSLEIEPGETVALVGASGSGKTTLSHLLLRLADPDLGGVLCEGVDLREIDPGEWRRRIAWVPQRPTIFAATVAENVRFADPGASDERVRDALASAGALRFVESLPQGLRTEIGDGRRALSSGESQRIALARAFLRDASLIVLDEPTANLDPKTEAGVVEASARLLEGRTGLLIAHRPALAAIADRVLELSDGSLVEAQTSRAAWVA